MVHTPCETNKDAYCRKGQKKHWKKCNKRFPHDFQVRLDQKYIFIKGGHHVV